MRGKKVGLRKDVSAVHRDEYYIIDIVFILLYIATREVNDVLRVLHPLGCGRTAITYYVS